MRFSALIASVTACLAASTVAQDFQSTCTYTTTTCAPFNSPTETITVYEVPFTVTSTSTYDCQGCNYVDVYTKPQCYGIGLPIETTTFVVEPEATTTVNVCSTTPATAPSGGLPPRRFGRH